MEGREPVPRALYHTISFDDVPKEWWLFSSPYPVLTCLALYLFTVTLGPLLMRARDPFQLTNILRIYNVLQVFYNVYMLLTIAVLRNYLLLFISNLCWLPKDIVKEKDIQIMIHWAWNLLFLKVLDLLDTGFMVLRKKNSHITFLHVYHHTATVFFTWYTFRYINFYYAIPLVIINTFVHSVMYSYYFLATFPQLKQYLWWKRHLTKLQLVQFVIALSYLSLVYSMGCPISPEFAYIWIFNVFVILLMFTDFYMKAYIFKNDKAL